MNIVEVLNEYKLQLEGFISKSKQELKGRHRVVYELFIIKGLLNITM